MLTVSFYHQKSNKLFFTTYSPNSALISVQQVALLGLSPSTLCHCVVRTHVSRFAPDWDP